MSDLRIVDGFVIESENFKPYELECKCGCGDGKMDKGFMELVEQLRTEYAAPLAISSAYRCPAHNVSVSSTGPAGPHTSRKAMDFRVNRGQAYKLLFIAMKLGFTGIGVAQRGGGRFLHLDTLQNHETAGPRPTIWSY